MPTIGDLNENFHNWYNHPSMKFKVSAIESMNFQFGLH